MPRTQVPIRRWTPWIPIFLLVLARVALARPALEEDSPMTLSLTQASTLALDGLTREYPNKPDS